MKEAPRQWHQNFDTFMNLEGFKCSSKSSCLNVKKTRNEHLIMLNLYVYNMLIVGLLQKGIIELKSKLSSQVDKKCLGDATHILRMCINLDIKKEFSYLAQKSICA